MKTKTIPFDLETAKKIQAGEIEGAIKTKDGHDVRIVAWDRVSTINQPLLALVQSEDGYFEITVYYTTSGFRYIDESDSVYDLVLEVPDDSPKHTFKPFDKVLVREDDEEVWQADFYCQYDDDSNVHICLHACPYPQCIPYEGNEHLLGTTDKPLED